MASRKRPDETLSISVLVSKLRDSSDSADFDEVEEELVVREMRLKKDHENKRKELEEKLKSEREERMKVEEERRVWMDKYEKLLEKDKRWGVGADEKVILDLMRKNKMLHEENMKMMREFDSALSRLEDETQKIMNRLDEKTKGEGRTDKGIEEFAHILDLEDEFDSLKVNEGITDLKKSSGIGNVAIDAIVIIDSDDESAGETLYPKMNSKRDEPDGFLTVDGVGKKPQMLKRKQAPSPNIGNNEFDDEDSVLDRIPISELIRKKCKKLMSSSSLASSDFSDHGKQAKPSRCDPVILRKSEENIRKKQKSLPTSPKSCVKETYHTFGNDDSDEASSNSSLKAEYEEFDSLFRIFFESAEK